MLNAFISVKSDNGIDEIKIRNNQFSVWKRYNKLLMGWLISFVSENLFSLVSQCSIANGMWIALEAYFVTE